MELKTLILAGGFATRLSPISDNWAKPLLPVAGKPIIQYILDKLPKEDIPVVSTNKKFAQDFKKWSEKLPREIEIIIEKTTAEEEKLGTVGAINFLVKKLKIDEEILVLGGDNIVEFDIEKFINTYRGNPTVALYDMGNKEKVKGTYGVAVLDDQNRVANFQEKPEYPKSTLVSTACYIYPRKVFPLITEFLDQAGKGQDAPGYFNEWLLKQKSFRIDAFVFEEPWYDIGNRASYIEANLDYLKDDLYKGKNVYIEKSIVKKSVILDNVSIKNSTIHSCVIDENSNIEGVRLDSCLIGKNSKIRMD
jgi:glucose-1-phosphate thymidylyltransferase